MPTIIRKVGDVEVRFFPDENSLDEVVLYKNGECLFHLEYLDDGRVWIGVGDVHVNLTSETPIRAYWIDDTDKNWDPDASLLGSPSAYPKKP